MGCGWRSAGGVLGRKASWAVCGAGLLRGRPERQAGWRSWARWAAKRRARAGLWATEAIAVACCLLGCCAGWSECWVEKGRGKGLRFWELRFRQRLQTNRIQI
jgi:hypothetical protein